MTDPRAEVRAALSGTKILGLSASVLDILTDAVLPLVLGGTSGADPGCARCTDAEAAEAARDQHWRDLVASRAEVADLRAVIHGCGCSAPYTECPHDEPLLPAVNRLTQALAEAEQRAEAAEAAATARAAGTPAAPAPAPDHVAAEARRLVAHLCPEMP